MDRFASLIRMAAQLPIFMSCVALFFLMGLTFFDVILRSTINAPIEAATELTRMSMAVVVFSIMPVMSFKGGHINVDLLDGLFDRINVTRWRDAVIALICGVMLYWPASRVVVLANRAQSYGDTTEYLNWPVFYMSWFIAIMSFVTMAALILRGLVLLFVPHYLEPQK
jgi:TRAP-type C4-dicarboxylate transport system permease small subunit